MEDKKVALINIEDVRRIIKLLLRNILLIILLPIGAAVVAYIYTHRLPDVYMSTAQILLKSNEAYDYQNKIYQGLGYNYYESYEQVSNQMRVIQSSELIAEVIDRLDLNASYYILGRLRVSEVYTHLPFRVENENGNAAFMGVDFMINILDTNSFRLRYELNGEMNDQVYQFGELILDNGLYLTIESESGLNAISINTIQQVNYMFRVHSLNSLISQYKSSLSVRSIDFTQIIQLELKDLIPERASQFLDTLAAVYIDYSLQNKLKVNDNTIRYIDKQIEEVTRLLNEVGDELEHYRDSNAIMNLEREENIGFERIFELQENMASVSRKISAIESLEEFIRDDRGNTVLPPTYFILSDDKQLGEAIQELFAQMQKLNDQLFSKTGENQAVNRLEERIENSKKEILTYLHAQRKLGTKELDKMQRELSSYEAQVRGIPKTKRQIINIQRRLSVNEELYSFLLSKRAETVIAKAGIIPETKLIERAHSVGIVEPDKKKIVASSITIGLAIALLIAVLRSMFFERIESLEEMKEISSLPILGGVPLFTDEVDWQYATLLANPKGGLTESFRALRANMMFMLPEKESKVLLVTSLLAGEGKTFTSLNLSMVHAMAKKKVLLIDLDLHKPKVGSALKMDKTVGVSSYLIGNNKFDEITQPHPEEGHLDIITAGPIPVNASELILNPKMQELIEEAKSRYEFVILDSPPISLISDALVLTGYADLKVLVVNARVAKRQRISFLEELINKNEIKGVSMVMNGIKINRFKYIYSRYLYGYSYGYGYGYGYGYRGYGEYGGYGSSEDRPSSDSKSS